VKYNEILAILKIETCRFSKGTFPYSPPTHTIEIDSIRQAVLLEIDGNQFQDGGHGGNIENQNTPIFERNRPPSHSQHAQSKLIRFDKPFSLKSTETNFKMVAMAAILKIETRRFSNGTFPYSPPTRTLKIDSIRRNPNTGQTDIACDDNK
jgi:hypothetical protein